MHLILVKILDSIDPVERGEKYDEPMTNALISTSTGVFNGGGTIATSKGIEGCYLDIEISDLARGMTVIEEVLRDADAPAGTTIEEYQPNCFVEALTKRNAG